MTSRRVVVAGNYGPDATAILEKSGFELVTWTEDRPADRAWLLEHVQGAVGILCTLVTKIDEELLIRAGEGLKVVSTMSVGFDHVDVRALAARGIKLGFTPDVLTEAVADTTVMLALMASRNARELVHFVSDGKWPSSSWSPFAFCGPQISSPNTTVGFLGYGRIAQATQRRLAAFAPPGQSLNFIYYTRSSTPSASTDSSNGARPVTLEDLASQSDLLILLLPGGDSTYHIVDEAFLRHMKPSSIIVNASRGTVIDSDALAKALREKWLWGAGLDVVEGEPNVGSDHPLVKEKRCVVLPHVGSATLETRVEMATLAARNLVAGLNGEDMPTQVDLSRYQ